MVRVKVNHVEFLFLVGVTLLGLGKHGLISLHKTCCSFSYPIPAPSRCLRGVFKWKGCSWATPKDSLGRLGTLGKIRRITTSTISILIAVDERYPPSLFGEAIIIVRAQMSSKFPDAPRTIFQRVLFKPKEWYMGTPYHRFSTLWKIQVYIY